MSTLFHQFTFFNWTGTLGLGWLVTFACLLYIFSGRYFFFLFALIANVLFVFGKMPSVPNHIFFEWFTNCMLLIVIFRYSSKPYIYFEERNAGKIWNTFSPVAIAAMVILYFFVVWHKLNSSFFNPAISCGGLFFEDVVHNLYLDKVQSINELLVTNILLFRNFSIYSTLIAEAIIPILLLTRRFRYIGLIFGVLFHLLLPLQGHEGIFSFSAMLFSFYVLFWNEAAFVKVDQLYKKYSREIGICFLTFFVALLFVRWYGTDLMFKMTGTVFFFFYGLSYLFLLFVSRKYKKPLVSTPLEKKSLFYYFVWLCPIIIFINGLSPYLGLKTETSFSMFSNLRTEAGISNHFFIPSGSQVFDFQKELVTIIDTDKESLKENDRYYGNDVHMVPFEFIRMLNKQQEDFYVRFLIGDSEYTVMRQQGVLTGSGGLNLEQNYFLKKFFRFRPVYPVESLCQH